MTTATKGGAVTGDSYPDERRAARAVYLVLTASFMIFADATIVSIASPAIRQSMHASLPEIEMMVSAYQIAYAATVITGGRLGDIHGRRVMFIAGFAGFAVTSAACGLATSSVQLIICRALQGVSAAMLSPQVLATIQIVLPPQKRIRAYAAAGAVLALASMMGPALGGLLIYANVLGLGWRPIFLINLPISLVAIILGRRLIPTLRSPSAKSLDIQGSLIVFVMLATLLIALALGQLYRWPAWTWLCLAASPVLAWIFLRSQRRQEGRGRSPLLPTNLWRDRAFRIGLALYVVIFSGVGTCMVYYYILLQTGYHVATWLAGLTTVSIGAGAIITSFASVRLVRRLGGRRVVIIGAVVSGLGFGSMLIAVIAVRNADLALWTMPSQFLAGCGVGLLIAPLLSVVMAGIRSAEVGAASGLLTTAQMIGRALGVVITGLLFVIPLPRVFAAATADQLATGMSYGLLYGPALFALSLLIIMRLPTSKVPSERTSVHA